GLGMGGDLDRRVPVGAAPGAAGRHRARRPRRTPRAQRSARSAAGTASGTDRVRGVLDGDRGVPGDPRRPTMIAGILVFLLCLAALLVSAWAARAADPHATVVELFDRALADRTVKLAMLVCWWWIGWHFLVAQTVDPGAVM